ncbi:MAG: hypothetical protein ACOYJI_03950 [Anaerovoracaceae bacterium]|jgi:hypothetical protein
MEETHQQQSEVTLDIPINYDRLREELSFYTELAAIFKEYDKDTQQLDFLISHLQTQIEEYDNGPTVFPDKNEIETVIRNHPYFKNPCDYPIRLLTILKYLRRKGVNINYADIDLYVDSILSNMSGVKKVGRGLYMCVK